MTLAAAATEGPGFHWLLFGHLVGLAVLGAGLGAYVVGLHRLAAAGTAGQLRAAAPVLDWGERVALVGYGLIVATGIGLGAADAAFGTGWLLTSLVLLVAIAAAGRFTGVRLNRLWAGLPPVTDPVPGQRPGSDPPAPPAARALAIHLPADVTVAGVVELVFLMVIKPGAAGIAASLAVYALAVAAAAYALRRAGAAQRSPAAAHGGTVR